MPPGGWNVMKRKTLLRERSRTRAKEICFRVFQCMVCVLDVAQSQLARLVMRVNA